MVSFLYKIRALFCGFLLLGGCNHVFYQPDHLEYYRLDRNFVEWQERRIGPPAEELNVWTIAAKTPEPFGTILHFHGNAQNMSAHISFIFWLLDFGFDLVCFDYRGYGKSSSFASRAHTLEDGQRVLHWMTEQKRYQGQAIFILGQSLGGAIAVSVLGKAPLVPLNIAGLVIDSGFSSYRTIARRKLASFWLTWPLQLPLSWLVSDEDSPYLSAASLDLPALFFHSRIDPAVPYEEGLELFSHVASKDKEMVTIEEQGHTLALYSHRDKLLNFLCRLSKNPTACHKHKSIF